MDFADLDLRAASERGSWVHLSYRGEVIYADDAGSKPSRVLIKGMGSDAVMGAFRKVERIETLRRERMLRTADKDADAVLAKSQADLEAAMADMVAAAVCEWENILYAGENMPCTRENVLKICGPGTLFFGQVTDAIRDEMRLFTVADSA
jgi:hypothetical protein